MSLSSEKKRSSVVVGGRDVVVGTGVLRSFSAAFLWFKIAYFLPFSLMLLSWQEHNVKNPSKPIVFNHFQFCFDHFQQFSIIYNHVPSLSIIYNHSQFTRLVRLVRYARYGSSIQNLPRTVRSVFLFGAVRRTGRERSDAVLGRERIDAVPFRRGAPF